MLVVLFGLGHFVCSLGLPELPLGSGESVYKTVCKKPDLAKLPLDVSAVGYQDVLKTIQEIPIEAPMDGERHFLKFDEETSARPPQEVDVDIEPEGERFAQGAPALDVIGEGGTDEPSVGVVMVDYQIF